MITVLDDPSLCTGCAACEASCGPHAITMVADNEGFRYPRVNKEVCIECNQCKRICPANPEYPKDLLHHSPQEFLAAWNKDEEIRRQSSSGGVFTALAEEVLAQGGLVVGAAFDKAFSVRHVVIEHKEDLARIRGSKYVQSEISSVLYDNIRQELRKGRLVLFSGTPCQVAGMRQAMKKLKGVLYVDILCHGVPSPYVWEEYRKRLPPKLSTFSFRDKRTGWKDYSLQWTSGKKRQHEKAQANAYMHVFLRDIALRPSCYCCAYAQTDRSGDVTLADFWGIERCHPEYDDNKGTSLVIVNSPLGKYHMDCCNDIESHTVSKLDAIAGNPIFNNPSHRPKERDSFYLELRRVGFVNIAREYKLGTQPIHARAVYKIRKIANRLIRAFGE